MFFRVTFIDEPATADVAIGTRSEEIFMQILNTNIASRRRVVNITGTPTEKSKFHSGALLRTDDIPSRAMV
jgi:hypothetical protein